MRFHMPTDTSHQRLLAKEPVDGRLVIFAGGRVIVDSRKAFVSRAFGVGRTWVVPFGDVRIWRLQKTRGAKRARDAFGTRISINLVISHETVEAVGWAYENCDGSAELDDFMFFSEENSRSTVLPVQPKLIAARR